MELFVGFFVGYIVQTVNGFTVKQMTCPAWASVFYMNRLGEIFLLYVEVGRLLFLLHHQLDSYHSNIF